MFEIVLPYTMAFVLKIEHPLRSVSGLFILGLSAPSILYLKYDFGLGAYFRMTLALVAAPSQSMSAWQAVVPHFVPETVMSGNP